MVPTHWSQGTVLWVGPCLALSLDFLPCETEGAWQETRRVADHSMMSTAFPVISTQGALPLCNFPLREFYFRPEIAGLYWFIQNNCYTHTHVLEILQSSFASPWK